MMTMALQPIHLVIYTVIVSSALTLSIKSPLYAIVAIGFLIPAEQFIKSLFGIQSKADGGFGSFASGALTMNAINSLRKPIGAGRSNGGNSEKTKDTSNEENTKIRQSSNKELSSWQAKQANDQGEDAKQLSEEGRQRLLSGNNDGGMDMTPVTGEGGEQADNNVRTVDDADALAAGATGAALAAGTQEDTSHNYVRKANAALNNGDEDLAEYFADKALSRDVANKRSQDNRVQAGVHISPEQQYKNLRKMRRNQWLGKQGKRAIKGFGKGALKGGRFVARATGAGVLGTIGVAAGVASGKGVGTALKYGAAGMYAGNVVGNNVANIAGGIANKTIGGAKTIKNATNTYKSNVIKDYKNAGMVEKAKELQLKQARKSNKYDDLIRQYSMKTGNNYTRDEKKNLRERIYDYDQNRAITDPEKIMDALQLEDKYKDKYSHNDIADVMELTKKFDSSYFTDGKKAEQLNKSLEARGLNDKYQHEVKSLLYEANFGSNAQSYEEFERQQSKPTAQQTTQQQTTRENTNGNNQQSKPTAQQTTQQQTTQENPNGNNQQSKLTAQQTTQQQTTQENTNNTNNPNGNNQQ